MNEDKIEKRAPRHKAIEKYFFDAAILFLPYGFLQLNANAVISVSSINIPKKNKILVIINLALPQEISGCVCSGEVFCKILTLKWPDDIYTLL